MGAGLLRVYRIEHDRRLVEWGECRGVRAPGRQNGRGFFVAIFFLIIFFCPTFLFGLVKKKNSLVALERGWIDETQCPDTEREFCFRASPLTAPTPLLTSLLIHSHANVSKKKFEQKLIV